MTAMNVSLYCGVLLQTVEMFQVSLTSDRSNKHYCGLVRGGAVGSGTALHVGTSRVRFPMASLEFLIDIILPAAL
jgi:hypothetical protein